MHSQIHEVGFFAGGSNYIGDVGKTTYINPNKPTFGIMYKWNKSPRHSWRISYMQSTISANDSDSNDPGRSQRGFLFDNSLKELSLGLEFNYFEFNLHTFENKLTPYLFSGINYVSYDKLYINNGETRLNGGSNSLALPIIIGVKASISRSLILAMEVGSRYSFTDNLDGSNPQEESLKSLQFGNINNNDWYVFSGLTLTYTFGEKPCYCTD